MGERSVFGYWFRGFREFREFREFRGYDEMAGSVQAGARSAGSGEALPTPRFVGVLLPGVGTEDPDGVAVGKGCIPRLREVAWWSVKISVRRGEGFGGFFTDLGVFFGGLSTPQIKGIFIDNDDGFEPTRADDPEPFRAGPRAESVGRVQVDLASRRRHRQVRQHRLESRGLGNRSFLPVFRGFLRRVRTRGFGGEVLDELGDAAGAACAGPDIFGGVLDPLAHQGEADRRNPARLQHLAHARQVLHE